MPEQRPSRPRHAACELPRRARTAGVTVPASALLISACGRHHGAALETADNDFATVANLYGQVSLNDRTGASRPEIAIQVHPGGGDRNASFRFAISSRGR